MSKIKDYIWTLPLIGGILALGAFFAPAAYAVESEEYIYLWIWALLSYQYYDYYWDEFDRGVIFSENPDVLVPSIICSVLIILSILVLIGSSLYYRKRMKDRKVNPIVWLGASLCILGSTIGWIVAIDNGMSSPSLPSFWSFFNPGFGVIGMFIGLILPIIGYGGARVSMKQKRETIQPLQKGVAVTETYDPITSTTPQISNIVFCPECGSKLSKENQKFCMDCGTAI